MTRVSYIFLTAKSDGGRRGRRERAGRRAIVRASAPWKRKTDSMAKVTEITTTSAAVMDAVKKGMDFVTNNAKVRNRNFLGKEV